MFLIGFRIAIWVIMIIFADVMVKGIVVSLLESESHLLMTNEKTPKGILD